MKHVSVSRVALWSLFGFVAVLQVSIVAAQALLAVLALCWIAMLASGSARFAAPAFFRPLLAYGVLTLFATVFSVDPRVSAVDDKQLLLFLIVPAVYEVARGARARTVAHVVITVGAATAVYGIVQYGILHYDNLGQRPQGSMGHYMTYSGLLVILFGLMTAYAVLGEDRRLRRLADARVPREEAALREASPAREAP